MSSKSTSSADAQTPTATQGKAPVAASAPEETPSAPTGAAPDGRLVVGGA